MTKLTSVFVAVLLSIFTVAAVENGSMAPDFELKGADGKTYKLSDFKGKTVVLEAINFQCPFVKKFYSVGKMQEYQAQAKKDGVVWLTICSSAKGKPGYMTADKVNKKLAKVKAVPAAYLLDTDGKVGKAYNMKTTPHMYVISPEGKLVYQGAIDSKKSTKSADIEKSTNYVTQALNELAAGKEISQPNTKAYGCSVKY